MPRCVIAKTEWLLLSNRSSTSPCLIRKSRCPLSMLPLTLALCMMCVIFNGPKRANVLRMSMNVSSFDRLTSIASKILQFRRWSFHCMKQIGCLFISFCHFELPDSLETRIRNKEMSFRAKIKRRLIDTLFLRLCQAYDNVLNAMKEKGLNSLRCSSSSVNA